MKEVSGKTKCGQIIARNAVLNYFFRIMVIGATAGYWDDGMVLREASTIDLLKTIGSPADRSLAKCNGAPTPCFPPVDSPHIRWSLDPTLL